jgi:HK97 family phage major capsid protein
MTRSPSILVAGASLAALAAAPRASGLVGLSLRADATDPAALLREIQSAFTAYQTQNDARLQAIEAGRSDPLATERVEALGRTVQELQAALDGVLAAQTAARLNGGRRSVESPEARQYSAAFDRFFRRGDGEDQLNALAVQARLSTGSDPDGGYLVPTEMEAAIDRVLGTVSAMRSIARVQPISSGSYKKRISLGGTRSGWVGETESRPATGTSRLAITEFTPGEIYAEPEATSDLLDDADVDLEAWIAEEVSIEFAEQEGAAFATGNGVKKPRGLLDYDKVADASYEWGKLGFTISGGSAGFAASAPWQQLQALIGTLKTGYRANARWFTNRNTVSKVMQFKDGEDRPLWQPSMQLGQPASLLGYPITEDDNMPDIGAGAFPMAFGDFRRGYLIVDRRGIRVLRDPYSAKPFVQFYTTKRVGGGVQNFEAIKLLKIADS